MSECVSIHPNVTVQELRVLGRDVLDILDSHPQFRLDKPYAAE